MVHARRPALLACLSVLGAIYATELFVVRSPLFHRAPGELGGLAVTIDLVVVAPLLYWLLVVRGTAVRARTVLPVAALGAMMASLLLPASQRETLRVLRWALAPAELALLYVAGRRAARALRPTEGAPAAARPDVLVALRDALREILPARAVADAVAFAVALLHYALLSWRARPDVRPGTVAFPAHRRSGLGAVVAAVGLLGCVEATVVHLALQSWSARGAWLATALSVYGLLWLVGLYRAVVLRPTLLAGDALVVRVGLLWTATVPLGSVAGATRATFPYPPRRSPGYLRAAPFGDPQLLLTLTEPLTVEGPYGRRREVRLVGLAADDPAALLAALEARRAAAVQIPLSPRPRRSPSSPARPSTGR